MPEDTRGERDLFEAIGTQRAMRRLKSDPVPQEHVERLLWAATRAPSGGNRQGWRFVVVTDQDKKNALQRLYSDAWERYLAQGYGAATLDSLPQEEAATQRRVLKSSQHLADHLHEAPVLILVCSLAPDSRVNTGIAAGASIYPAVQNLLLAARGLGLGATLTTIHRWNEAGVREVLGIPETVDTAALIPIGWPKGRFGAGARKPIEDVTYWDAWGAKRK